MNTNQRHPVIFVLAMSLVILSCRFGQSFAPTPMPAPTSTSTLTPLPISTLTPKPLPTSTLTLTPLPTSTPDPKVLTLKATSDLLNLLDTWNGKYVIFVGRNTDIKTLEDLNGIPVLCDSVFNSKNAANDMEAFNTAAGVTPLTAYGNDIPQFLQIMAGNQNIVAFISKANADRNSLQNNSDLKIIVFK